MTDFDEDAQATMMRQITAQVLDECMKRGFQPALSIDITDQTGATVKCFYMSNDDLTNIIPAAVQYPEGMEGPRPFVFPLQIHASDHTGKTYDTTIERMH